MFGFDLFHKVLGAPGVARTLATLTHVPATIFRVHRFRDDERGVFGRDPSAVRQILEVLRREKFDLVGIEEVFARLRGEGPSPHRTVAFAIDDGYYEQASVAAPIFAEFDCPVTTFVTTGFLDRKTWLWWDRIAYVFEHTKKRKIELELDQAPLRYRWANAHERSQARADFTERCKSASEAEKNAVIQRLAETADVDLPEFGPSCYAPMSWDDLRACETRGMTFGAHTVTHPILAQTSDEESAEEIIGSVERLRAEAARPVSIFCYPNGRPQDFGEREFATLRSVGIVGALGQEGHASRNAFRAPDGAYRVPRVGFPRAVPNLSKQLIRSLVSLGSPEQGPTDRYQSGTGPEQPAHPEPTGEYSTHGVLQQIPRSVNNSQQHTVRHSDRQIGFCRVPLVQAECITFHCDVSGREILNQNVHHKTPAR